MGGGQSHAAAHPVDTYSKNGETWREFLDEATNEPYWHNVDTGDTVFEAPGLVKLVKMERDRHAAAGLGNAVRRRVDVVVFWKRTVRVLHRRFHLPARHRQRLYQDGRRSVQLCPEPGSQWRIQDSDRGGFHGRVLVRH